LKVISSIRSSEKRNDQWCLAGALDLSEMPLRDQLGHRFLEEGVLNAKRLSVGTSSLPH
jgi:hypothetical protein